MPFSRWVFTNIYFLLAGTNLVIAGLWTASVTFVQLRAAGQASPETAHRVYVATHACMIAIFCAVVGLLFAAGLHPRPQ
jgi:hypothetical protein